ncbi:glycosyltransferase family 32 protein [Desarmillaria tabescens]|uniref:Glycosyltransferase family 32 protein n=1 Tax=Armillaria tabescens TaxID=1929756 RepID=A0AA39NM64_ARMTA|nr:glycosyltransferase family 32 protein [Desarmillaria tabescens]KAK0468211.1 glycosyltransferase family 32 protein [Desarmillaria tabescens]
MARRRPLCIFLSLLGLFLLGTVVVLSSITYYLSIDPNAYLSEDQVPILGRYDRWNASEHGQVERIPRILHQTWRTETLPEKWRPVSQECRDLMPDYTTLGFWIHSTITRYPIQRADAIRYFILHHFGGVYLDLDIGCKRPLDPLLAYPVILPKTIPVGISNDLIFSEKGHPFMAQVIHSLVTFDHSWVLNYPTVMFSTGPMFLSAQYSIFTSSHASAVSDPIRVLPKSLYGKNAKEGEAPHSFFSHFYGSSWHADDAAFIGFLGHWGKVLMWIGLIVLLLGLLSIAFPGKQRRYSLRRIGGYEVPFPRWSSGTGHWHFGSSSSSSSDSDNDSPIDPDVPVLQLPFDVRPSSPTLSDTSTEPYAGRPSSPLVDAFRRLRNRVAALTSPREDVPRTPFRNRRQRYSRGVLFFLPAIFTQSQDIELGPAPAYSDPQGPLLPRPSSRARVQSPSDKLRQEDSRSGSVEARTPLSEGTSNSRSSPENSTLIDFGHDSRPSSSSHHTRSRSSPHRES